MGTPLRDPVPQASRGGIDRHAVWYLAITLSISTGYEVIACLALGSEADPTTIGLTVGLPVMLVPMLVAIAFIRWAHGEPLAAYGLGPRAGLGGARLLAAAFLGPALVLTLPMFLVSRLVLGYHVHSELSAGTLAAALLLNIPIATGIATFTVALGEEAGWRGYLLRRLRTTLSWRASSLVIGPAWALYHLPLVLLSPTGVKPWAVAITYSVTVAALSFPMTWFAARARRGSVFVPALLHAALNAWNQTLLGEPAFGIPGLLQAERAGTWIVAVEGLLGMTIALVVAVPFWIALGRMDRAGIVFESPRPRST